MGQCIGEAQHCREYEATIAVSDPAWAAWLRSALVEQEQTIARLRLHPRFAAAA